MKTIIKFIFLFGLIATTTWVGVAYGSDLSTAISYETHRYSGIDVKYIYMALGMVVVSFLLGLIFSKVRESIKP